MRRMSVTKRVSIVGLVAGLCCVGQVPADGRRAIVSGVVMSAQTGEPLKSAAVSLKRLTPPGRFTVSSKSDVDGKFSFRALPPGIYAAAARKAGFDQGSAPPNVEVPADEDVSGVEVVLWKSAAISGRLYDAEGYPMAGAEVRACQFEFTTGVRRLVSARYTFSDDRGQYRLHGLRKGAYIVGSKIHPVQSDPRTLRAAPINTFFPATMNASEASALELHWGAELESIDLRFEPVDTYSISGTALNRAGAPCGGCLLAVGRRQGARLESILGRTELPADGRFDLAGLIPSRYVVLVEYSGAAVDDLGLVEIEVSDRDVRNLALRVQPTSSVTGSLELEDSPEHPEIGRPRLWLQPIEMDALLSSRSSLLREDGSFDLSGVAPGPYQIKLKPVPPGAYLKRLIVSGRAVSRLRLQAPEGAASLQVRVVLGYDGGVVSGAIEGAKSGQFWVALTPQGERTPSEGLRLEKTDSEGGFRLDAVAPGRYVALAAARRAQLVDPAYRSRFQRYSRRVKVAPRSQSSIELTLPGH